MLNIANSIKKRVLPRAMDVVSYIDDWFINNETHTLIVRGWLFSRRHGQMDVYLRHTKNTGSDPVNVKATVQNRKSVAKFFPGQYVPEECGFYLRVDNIPADSKNSEFSLVIKRHDSDKEYIVLNGSDISEDGVNICGSLHYYIDCAKVVGEELHIWGYDFSALHGVSTKLQCNIICDEAVKSECSFTRVSRPDVHDMLSSDDTIAMTTAMAGGYSQEPDSDNKWGFFARIPLRIFDDEKANNTVVLSFTDGICSNGLTITKENLAEICHEEDRNVFHYVNAYYDKLDEATLEAQRATVFEKNPKISIVVPAYKTPHKFLCEMVDSLIAQTYPNWELCIADASCDTSDDSVSATLAKYAKSDSRVRYSVLDDNYGISGNTNEALKLAQGDYIGLLDHDDLLTPDALFEVVKKINEENAKVIYTDEDKVNMELDFYLDPAYKPDLDLEDLRSRNYITHFFVFSKDICEKVGEFDPECDGSQDYDYILRCVDEADKVSHVSRIVYHWRCHVNSTAANPASKLYCYEAGRHAIDKHLRRRGENAKVFMQDHYGYYRVEYALPDNSKDIDILQLSIGDFASDLSAARDELLKRIKASSAEYIFMIDGDITGVETDYSSLKDIAQSDINGALAPLTANLARQGIRAVNCKVIDEDNKVISFAQTWPVSEALNPYKELDADEMGYAGLNQVQQTVGAVSLNGLMIKRVDAAELLQGVDNSGLIFGESLIACPFVRVQVGTKMH